MASYNLVAYSLHDLRNAQICLFSHAVKQENSRFQLKKLNFQKLWMNDYKPILNIISLHLFDCYLD